jgi:oligogalacturonide lyase
MKPAWPTFAAAVCLAAAAHASDVGRRFPSELRTLLDPATGAQLRVLTDSPGGDAKLYQTHPQWTADGRRIVFRSGRRSQDGHGQAFAVDPASGEIVQLTDGPGVNISALNVARRSNRLYYTRAAGGRVRLIELDLERLFADAAGGAVKPDGYERVVAVLPADYRDSGGFTLDADEKTAYFGVSLQDAPPRPPGQPVPQVPGGIRAVDLKTGAYRKVIDVPFRMGHVQANPWVPGEILYCHETGGDAPQRMFIVRADGSGNRPLFLEQPTDWVTHEVFVDPDHVMFNLMGHTAELRRRPTGIMVVNLRTDAVENAGQTEVGRSFWHSNGTPDGRWAVGDDFDGAVTLIDRRTGERRVLTRGHVMRPDHTHPNFSPDGRWILIQSGMLSGGRKLNLMLVPVPGEP